MPVAKKALQLRITGSSWEEIAEKCGYTSTKLAQEAVNGFINKPASSGSKEPRQLKFVAKDTDPLKLLAKITKSNTLYTKYMKHLLVNKNVESPTFKKVFKTSHGVNLEILRGLHKLGAVERARSITPPHTRGVACFVYNVNPKLREALHDWVDTFYGGVVKKPQVKSKTVPTIIHGKLRNIVSVG